MARGSCISGSDATPGAESRDKAHVTVSNQQGRHVRQKRGKLATEKYIFFFKSLPGSSQETTH